MTLIELNKKSYSIPSTWDELSQKQLLLVMSIIFLRGYKAEQILLRLLPALAGLNNYRFFKCKVEELEEYFYLTGFLFQQEIKFTKNLIPEYQHSHTNFFGPSDALDNLRMKEFTLTEDLYIKWFDAKATSPQALSKEEGEEALNELVAILYRPAPANYDFEKNPEGDCRERFNQNTSAYYARTYICTWPMEVKLAIATWYGGCRSSIIRSNPDVFAGGGDPARFGLVSVMLSVAEGKVFGDFEKVEEQYVNLVMMQLNEVMDQAKRIEKTTSP